MTADAPALPPPSHDAGDHRTGEKPRRWHLCFDDAGPRRANMTPIQDHGDDGHDTQARLPTLEITSNHGAPSRCRRTHRTRPDNAEERAPTTPTTLQKNDAESEPTMLMGHTSWRRRSHDRTHDHHQQRHLIGTPQSAIDDTEPPPTRQFQAARSCARRGLTSPRWETEVARPCTRRRRSRTVHLHHFGTLDDRLRGTLRMLPPLLSRRDCSLSWLPALTSRRSSLQGHGWSVCSKIVGFRLRSFCRLQGHGQNARKSSLFEHVGDTGPYARKS